MMARLPLTLSALVCCCKAIYWQVILFYKVFVKQGGSELNAKYRKKQQPGWQIFFCFILPERLGCNARKTALSEE